MGGETGSSWSQLPGHKYTSRKNVFTRVFILIIPTLKATSVFATLYRYRLVIRERQPNPGSVFGRCSSSLRSTCKLTPPDSRNIEGLESHSISVGESRQAFVGSFGAARVGVFIRGVPLLLLDFGLREDLGGVGSLWYTISWPAMGRGRPPRYVSPRPYAAAGRNALLASSVGVRKGLEGTEGCVTFIDTVYTACVFRVPPFVAVSWWLPGSAPYP